MYILIKGVFVSSNVIVNVAVEFEILKLKR